MSLAPPSNLQSLMAQLANVESSFINILFQAALRMSDLYGNKMFLLVQSNTGTYYSGSDSLCSAYELGSLAPTSTQELRVLKEFPTTPSYSNPASNPLHNFQVGSRPHFNNHAVPSFRGVNQMGVHQTAPNTAYDSTSANESISPRGRPSWRDTLERSVRAVVSQESSRKRSSDSPKAVESSPAKKYAKDSGEAFKREPEFKAGSDESDVIVLDDDDDDFVGGDGVFDVDDFGPFSGLTMDPRESSKLAADRYMAGKIDELKSLPPERVFEKGSKGHQLLSHVFYSYGRDLAHDFKAQPKTEDLTKSGFFNENFEKFIKPFDDLTHFKARLKKCRNQIVSASTYVKEIANKAYHKRLKKLDEVEAAGGPTLDYVQNSMTVYYESRDGVSKETSNEDVVLA